MRCDRARPSRYPDARRALPGGAEAEGIDVAGWRFSDFSYTGVLDLDPSAVGVRIESLGDFERRATVRFSLDTDVQPTQVGDLTLRYRADFAPADSVTAFGTQVGGSVPLGIFSGTLAIDQTVSSLDGSDLDIGAPVSGTLTVNLFDDGPGRFEDNNSAFTSLNIKPGVRLQKEVSLTAHDSGQPSILLTDTFFSVPEPRATGLALPVALWALARRRGSNLLPRVN